MQVKFHGESKTKGVQDDTEQPREELNSGKDKFLVEIRRPEQSFQNELVSEESSTI